MYNELYGVAYDNSEMQYFQREQCFAFNGRFAET